MSQISLFDGAAPLKITKPIRLIECFAGYGSQALSLKYLGVPFEHWRIAEWAVKSIQAYKDMHFPNDDTDYSKEHGTDWLVEYLFNKGISADYNKPMTKAQITRMGENKIRTVYNNIIATNNLVSVTNVRGEDLNITDTDRYTYILTYSFPCQDLSNAGLGKGMAKGSGTRSGLLWEIERILDECTELPQILLMENVPDVIGKKNFAHFTEWYGKLESLGYKSWYKVMNAKEYGMPQNRERCFMVSALGDNYYEFPKTVPLELRLKDLLEPDVDEKYYLSEKALQGMFRTTYASGTLAARTESNGIIPTIRARDYKDPKLAIVDAIPIKNATSQGYDLAYEGDSINLAYPNSETRRRRVGKNVAQTLTTSDQIGVVVKAERAHTNDIKCDQVGLLCGGKWERMHENIRRVYSPETISPTVTACCGGNHEVKIEILDEQNGYIRQDGTVGTITTDGSSPKHNNRVIEGERRIRKLTPRECFRLMGVKDEDFERVAKNQSDSSLYHLAGDSIVTNCLVAIFKEML